MSDAKSILDAFSDVEQPEDMPPGPWPSDFELETRARLSAIEAHQLRSDRLITELQLEGRRNARAQAAQGLRLESKIDSLVSLLRARESNGHG